MNLEDVLKLAHRMGLQGMEFYDEQQARVKLPLLRELFSFLIEKDFAQFYEKSASGSDGEIRDLFNKLADWEAGHAKMMKDEMGKIISRNALDLGFYPFE